MIERIEACVTLIVDRVISMRRTFKLKLVDIGLELRGEGGRIEPRELHLLFVEVAVSK